MSPKELHIMKIKEEMLRIDLKRKRPRTPLGREIEKRQEQMVRGILDNSIGIINKQLEIASLPVLPGGKDNDVIIKATNSLLDRTFGKPKESVEFAGTVQFSLKALAQERLNAPSVVTPLEDMI